MKGEFFEQFAGPGDAEAHHFDSLTIVGAVRYPRGHLKWCFHFDTS